MAKRFRRPLYQCWCNIKCRCYNKNVHQYERYGGRGITMCDEWKNNSSAFEKWAMENGYEKGLTIDRIDNNGNYSPDNCRFITMGENNKNKRNTILITIDDNKTLCLKDYCKEYNFPYISMTIRLKRGMSFQQALMTPFRNGDKI